MATLDYKNLDLNERINLKGLVESWSRITIERFQKNLDDKVYARRSGLVRGSMKRDGKGRYISGSGQYKSVRTGKLRADWRKRLYVGRNGGMAGLQLSFPLYGRFVDMGVGKGTSYALSKYQRVRKNGETPTRKPARWYSKEKGYQVHRLRELMARYYVNATLDSLENYLTQSVTVHV